MIAKKLLRLLILALLVLPAVAVHAQKPTAKPIASTTPEIVPEGLDSLIAKDSYVGYAEVRMIGRQTQSHQINEIFEAFKMLDALPPEVASIRDFLTDHSDELDGSRAVIAFYPSRPGLPQTLIAVEMDTPEAAAKLAPQAARMLLAISTSEKQKEGKGASANNKKPPTDPKMTIEQRLESQGIFMKVSGKLICISEGKINFSTLRPPTSKPMTADTLFEMGRSRFSSDPLYIYYNQKVHTKVEEQQRKDLEAEQERVRVEAQKNGTKTIDTQLTQTGGDEEKQETETNEPAASLQVKVEPNVQANGTDLKKGDEPLPDGAGSQTKEPSEPPSATQVASTQAVSSMFSSMARLASIWPDAIGFGLSFEGDDIAVRAVLLGKGGDQSIPVPFLPFLITSDPIAGKASSLAPLDTDIFVTASLDLSRMYDTAIAPAPKEKNPETAQLQKTSVNSTKPTDGVDDTESPTAKQMAFLETLLGFRIKEDLIGSFGKEVAIAIRSQPHITTTEDGAKQSNTNPNYVLMISVQNKDGAQRMLPKLLEVFGLKSTGTGATERVGDIDITNYNSFALAFVEDFVIIAADNAGIKEVLDARSHQQVLQNSNSFRDATAWQSQQRTGQIYLSEFLIGSLATQGTTVFDYAGETGRLFQTRFNAKARPVSFALSNDGAVQQHELRIPTSTLLNYIGEATIGARYSQIIINESSSKTRLISIANAEKTYRAGKGQGSYGTLEDLEKAHLFGDYKREASTIYKFDFSSSGDTFEATATPIEYGEHAKHSFYIDQLGILHGGDLAGRRATASDPVIPAGGFPGLLF